MAAQAPIPKLEFKKPSKAGQAYFEIIPLRRLIVEQPPADHDPYKLHRLNFFAILVNTGPGPLVHQIDFTEITLQANEAVAVSKGQTHCFRPQKQHNGILMVFAEEFMQEHLLPAVLASLSKLYHYGAPIIYKYNDRLQRVVSDFEAELKQAPGEHQRHTIGALLTIFLLTLERQHNAAQSNLFQSGHYAYFVRFRSLVEQHFTQSRDAAFYASKLNITYKHLNDITRKSVGLTAKAFIDELVVLEAKRLLISTDLRSKEIAYDCGFEEPSNFVKFFKKSTGVTPATFRKQESQG